MLVIKERNVNVMLVRGLEELRDAGRRQSSRAGDVVVMPTPVMSVYKHPTERVLFCEKRDANPFFHFFESLWMLNGRRDAAALNHYISDFGDRFAESASGNQNWENENGNIHDAYGHRWRNSLGFDQLDAVVERLRANPDDRQCVIQMWDGRNECQENYTQTAEQTTEWYGENDLLGDWKTRPCNTHVYLRVRSLADVEPELRVLDITVLCRSNDVIWGAYGANAVQFSMLQEYLAGRIGVQVGLLYQFSNNFHGYLDTLDKIGDPDDLSGSDPYEDATVRTMSIGEVWEEWDNDLSSFMNWHDQVWASDGQVDYGVPPPFFINSWFRAVAVPMTQARFHWKNKRRERAMECAKDIMASDWRMAVEEWMQRRIDR